MLTRTDPTAATGRFRDLKHMIGNTPLLAIRFTYRGAPRVLYAKAEHVNMTGSIKDRMAFHILKAAYGQGRIAPGDTIVEATSGNTGIAFSAIGRALGHPVTIFMPDWMSQERVPLIKSLGATVVGVSQEQGGFLGSIRLAEEMAAAPHVKVHPLEPRVQARLPHLFRLRVVPPRDDRSRRAGLRAIASAKRATHA